MYSIMNFTMPWLKFGENWTNCLEIFQFLVYFKKAVDSHLGFQNGPVACVDYNNRNFMLPNKFGAN